MFFRYIRRFWIMLNTTLPGPDSPPPEATGSFGSLLAYDLLGQTTDFTHLSPPLLPLPGGDLLLLPIPPSQLTSPVRQPPRRPLASVASSRRDPGGTLRHVHHTGNHPLISEGLARTE